MSVATAVYEQTCHVCDALRLFVMRTFINIQRGRQLSANIKIFQHYGQFDREAPYHLQRVQDQTNKEYDQKLAELKQRIMWMYTDEEWELISKPNKK